MIVLSGASGKNAHLSTLARPEPTSRRPWREVFPAAYGDDAEVRTTVQHWSGLTAVVQEVRCTGAFEFRYEGDYHRLAAHLDEVGGRLRARSQPQRARSEHDMAHALYYIPAGTPAWIYSDKLRYVRHISLQFDATTLNAFFPDGDAPKLPTWPRMGFSDQRLLSLARLFEGECDSGRERDSLLGDSLSISLLSLIANLEGGESCIRARGGLTPRQLRLVTDCLKTNLDIGIAPAELAKLLGISRSHFCRAFKATTGRAPHAWLTEIRIEKAYELLLTTSQSLADISLATGFSDQAHFTRVFNRMVGESPGVWRRTRCGPKLISLSRTLPRQTATPPSDSSRRL